MDLVAFIKGAGDAPGAHRLVTQRTPDVGEPDVERILQRDYSHADLDEIRRVIRSLEVREKWRVVLACLKNAAGSVDKLRGQLEDAAGHYREILSEAEYPEATRKWNRIEKLPPGERQAIYDRDWRQYEEWLLR